MTHKWKVKGQMNKYLFEVNFMGIDNGLDGWKRGGNLKEVFIGQGYDIDWWFE
jgi:hypothetical protein